MMTRPLRIIGSFVVVVAAYCVYSLAAVPLIEPEDAAGDHGEITAEEREQALGSVANQRADLRRWFKDGDWELTSPKILETAQGKLLLRDYHPDRNDAHVVTLNPCTMIFLPEGQFDDEEERLRRAIVLRSPDGATLRFAEPIDIKKGQMGSKIVSGHMPGKVTIRSEQRSPGPEDDLLLLTENVTLDNDCITTPQLVEFFYGPNRGRGREMRLELTTAAEKAAQPSSGPAKTFELARDVHMRMETADGDLFMVGAKPAAPAAAADMKPASPKPPVEINCQGRLHVDLRRYVATFHERVEVVRLNPVGDSDRLTCQRLSVRFEPDPTVKTAAGDASGKGMPRLRPRYITADGNPVILDSRSNGVEARGRRLEYDVQTRSGKLLDNDEATLRQLDPATRQLREIHARELEFESDPESPSGPPRRVDARGKGWLRGSPPADPDQKLYVKWTTRLTFQPYEGSQVLSILGNAYVESTDTGSLEADEIHVWLRKAAAGTQAPSFGGPTGQGGLVPEKMTARGHVRPNAPQLSGIVREMDIWFAPEEPAVVASGPADPAAAEPPPPEQKAERVPPDQRWNVSGDVLKVQARFVAGKTEVTEVQLDGDALCKELPSLAKQHQPLAGPPEQLMVIQGEQIHLVQPAPGEAKVRITGRPARVDAQGMTLIGGDKQKAGNIHLDRAKNQLWIPGEGTLVLPVDEDMQGRKLARPQQLEIHWNGRMRFDGLTADFERDVVARNDEAVLKTPELQVTFREQVRFGSDNDGTRPQVQRLVCRQHVDLDRHERQRGRVLSWERLVARDLVFDYATGDFVARGDGVITRTWLDDGSTPAVTPGGSKKKPAAPPSKNRTRLVYLNATFVEKLTGNQRRDIVTLHRRVTAVYGPVLRWQQWLDPNYPKRLGTEGFVLKCDQLTVAKNGLTGDSQPAVELYGEGNILIEGSDFLSRCRNLRYASNKDLLVLSGDGRSAATFYRDQQNGSNPIDFAANRILYEPKLQRLNVNNFESLDVMGLPSQKSPEKK
ncbi:MAG TPA: hypothetical protein PK867_05280 [Pirellulales bacterium]|nr:hypothetical protein [Pirellulales bacterium]